MFVIFIIFVKKYIMYIVWRNKFESYNKPQGDGYFESYKDKLSDNWTLSSLLAKKYKTIGPAINRSGLNITTYGNFLISFEKFLELNLTDQAKRDLKLSSLLDGDIELDGDIFINGRVDKILPSGEVVPATKEVLEYIKNEYQKQVDKTNKLKIKNQHIDEPNKNFVEHVEGEDFWEGF